MVKSILSLLSLILVVACWTDARATQGSDDQQSPGRCWAQYLLEAGLCSIVSTSQTYLCIAADAAGFPAGANPTREECDKNLGYKCHSMAWSNLIFCLGFTVESVIKMPDGSTIEITIRDPN